MTATKIKLIEREVGLADYDLPCVRAIIEHPKHGRLLLVQGYGGESTPDRGQVRWRHGFAAKLRPDDTLASLEAGEWNDGMSLYSAVWHDCDPTRPITDLNPVPLALAAGLEY